MDEQQQRALLAAGLKLEAVKLLLADIAATAMHSQIHPSQILQAIDELDEVSGMLGFSAEALQS